MKQDTIECLQRLCDELANFASAASADAGAAECLADAALKLKEQLRFEERHDPMNRPLTLKELAAIERARWSVRRLVNETPACLEGDQLVHALMVLLSASADEVRNFGAIGIAAAAIAELVERERGERTVCA